MTNHTNMDDHTISFVSALVFCLLKAMSDTIGNYLKQVLLANKLYLVLINEELLIEYLKNEKRLLHVEY